MKRLVLIIAIIGTIFAIWMVIERSNPSLIVTSEYSNGKIITYVKAKNIQNIASTEYRYRTCFLEQYANVKPRVHAYSFPSYEDTHIYEISADLLQGKKDYLEVEVEIIYGDGTHELIGKSVIQGIKQKIYYDFVIEPEMKDDKVYYHAEGLTAIIDKEVYSEEIIFYSNPNDNHLNISVGFQKDYALYQLNVYDVISKEEALDRNFQGFSPVDSTKYLSGDESYIVIEYGMIDLVWDGLYPYDLDGNDVFYEGEMNDEGITLIKDNQMLDISKASYKKYSQMLSKMPNITFEIPNK